MRIAPHVERHFTSGQVIRDIVIGMSDGLTVPFALAAGLSGAVDTSSIVVTAGVAELAAGAISMGLGGYLAANSDREHYESEKRREQWEIKNKTAQEIEEVVTILMSYGLSEQDAASTANALSKDPEKWIDFMMQLELHLDKPDPKRALISAVTIGGSYVAGGIIPLSAYIFVHSAHLALPYSVGMTMVALLFFGAFKGHFTGVRLIRSALQTLLIGGIAATAAFIIARLIS